MTSQQRIHKLLEAIPSLTDQRIELIEQVVQVFQHPKNFSLKSTDLLTVQMVEDFGDMLRMHHCFSREPFSKDKFEYALERVLVGSSIDAQLAPRGQRGFDIRIGTQKFSLKTEAAKNIKKESIHISKFMELGGGDWGADPNDLIGLRNQYLGLLTNIERILTLRALRKGNPVFEYELVEIPKTLLLKAQAGRLEMMTSSRQFPKPGYCYVEEDGELLYSLYFDGGGERKLQVKGLKKSLCCIHANWTFDLPDARC